MLRAIINRDIKYLLFYAVVSAVYFRDVFLKDNFLAYSDGLNLFYPITAVVSDQYGDLTLPLWNPYIFSGFPLMATIQHSVFHITSLLPVLVFEPVAAFNLNMMIHYALAGFFMSAYLRRLGVHDTASLGGGLAYAFLGYMPAHLAHPSIVYSAAWAPLVLTAFEGLRRGPNIRDLALGAIAISLQLFAGHTQIWLYTYILVALYICYGLISSSGGSRSRFGLYCTATLALGALISLPQLVVSFELMSMSERADISYRFFSVFAFPLYMVPAFIFPFMYGKGYGGPSWGPVTSAYIDGMEGYVGILPFLLALGAAILLWKKDSRVRFWALSLGVVFMLSLGFQIGPLNRLMYHLPGFNNFRGASKHMYEVSMALSVLAAFGFESLIERENRRFRSGLLIVLGLLIAGSVLCATVFRDQIVSAIWSLQYMHRPDTSSLANAMRITNPAIYLPLAFMSAYILLLAMFRGSGKLLVASAMFVVFLEAASYMPHTPHKTDFPRSYEKEVFEYLAKSSPDRVAYITRKLNLSTLGIQYGIYSIDGVDPLISGDYAELLNMQVSGFSDEWMGLARDNLMLSMLNVRHIVADSTQGYISGIKGKIQIASDGGSAYEAPIGFGLPSAPEYAPIYRKVFQDGPGRFIVYENLNCLPRAYSVANIKRVDSIAELRSKFYGFQLNPRTDAALSRGDIESLGSVTFSVGNVRLIGYGPGNVELETEFGGTGFVVLADQYYPGWKAYIDGKPVKIYKTNGVLRGVVVPEGEHRLIFRYRPKWVFFTAGLSGILLALSCAMLILNLRGRRN